MVQINSSIEKLYTILNELSFYKRSRQDLRLFYVNKRLIESLKSYYNSINNDYKYLNKKDSSKVFKQLGRDA